MNDARTGTPRRVADRIQAMLRSGAKEAVRAYLAEGFLTSAMQTLFHARRDAGLTQTEVAKRLNTRQSVIARWEADEAGSISLRNYARLAEALDLVPLDITLVPAERLREYALANPGAPRTTDAYMAWIKSAHPTDAHEPSAAGSH